MKYSDVKRHMIFVEVTDRAKHPRRTSRKIFVRDLTIYSAEVEVIEGRGKGDVLYLALKKITDTAQWTLEAK